MNNTPNKGGRPKGSPNKRSLQYLEVLEKHNFCPASAMIEIYEEARKEYEAHDDPQIKSYYLKISSDMAKEMATYAYPRRKAVEVEVNPILIQQIKELENKTNEELFEILRISEPVKLIEQK